MNFVINVANKIATATDAPVIICGNSDYVIDFIFDSEWDGYVEKTARFKFKKDGKKEYIDVLFSGTQCNVPILFDIDMVEIGVYAGNLSTTTTTRIDCEKSILCGIDENEEKVYKAGKQAEYDRFWDVFQSNGTRTNYNYGIAGQGWNTENFKPKYDMIPTAAAGMFYGSTINGDLVQILEECGVKLDFSKSTAMTALFNSNYYITRIGVIDCTNATSLSNVCSYCSGLETIDKIILKNDGSQSFNQTFISCSKLSEIRFEGEIGKNDLNMQWSNNLTIESLRSIIDCLADKSADTSGTVWEVKIGATNYAKLSEDDIRTVQNKGWVVS